MNDLIQISSFACVMVAMATIRQMYIKKIEVAVIPIASISIIGIFSYLSNFILISSNINLLIYCLSIISIVILKRKNFNIKEFLHSNRLFIYFVIFLYITTYGAYINFWDDHYWASFVKYLAETGHFWTKSDQLVNGRYSPGLPVWQKLFVSNKFENEQGLFFASGLIIISCIYAIIPDKLTAKRKILVVIVYLTIIKCFISYGLRSIMVDCVIGLMFAVILIQIYRNKKDEDDLITMPIIIFMGVIKETAFLFSMLSLAIYAFKLINENRLNKKNIITLTITLFILLFNYIIWQKYCIKENLSEPMMKSIIIKVYQDIVTPSDFIREFIKIFAYGIVDNHFPTSWLKIIHGNILINFFIIMVGLLYFEKKKELKIGFILGFVGYTLVVCIFWLYLTSEYEAINLASLERYFGTYFLSFAILLSYHLVVTEKIFEKNYKKICILFILLFPPSPQMLYPNSFIRKLPAEIKNKLNIKSATKERDSVQTISYKIQSTLPAKSRVWLIWQNSQGYELMIMRYLTLPIIMTSNPWSLGEKYYAGDVWTANLNEKEFFGFLDQVEYIAVGNVDNQFVRSYSWAFSEEPKNGDVFEKIYTNKGVRLSKK